MRKVNILILALSLFSSSSSYAFASNNEIPNFTNSTIHFVSAFAALLFILFLIRGGYYYIISSGNAERLISAKRTILNASIGLLIIIASTFISSYLQSTFNSNFNTHTGNSIILPKIQESTSSSGISQALNDAISGFLQVLIQSATKPTIDGIIGFLSSTPSLIQNQTIFHFWLIMVGIADSLFVLVIVLLGLQIMSSESLGFGEVNIRSVMPKLMISFIGIHCSIFILQWFIDLCNILSTTLVNITGGIDHAWIIDAFSSGAISIGSEPIITLIFLLLFLILSIILLLFYISRLIIIGLIAVLSPLIFLIWPIPRFSDFAEITLKSYLVTIFTVFIHLVIIELASAMLTVPGENVHDNTFISVLIGVGLLFLLIKTPSVMMQFIFYTKGVNIMKSFANQVINVASSRRSVGTELVKHNVV